MKTPVQISIWFICCVSIGLLMSWLDGVHATAIMQAASIALAIGLTSASGCWLWYLLRKNQPPSDHD